MTNSDRYSRLGTQARHSRSRSSSGVDVVEYTEEEAKKRHGRFILDKRWKQQEEAKNSRKYGKLKQDLRS